MGIQSTQTRYIAKFPKSQALYEKAKIIFPRGVTHDVRFVQPFPIYITHAKGSRKWDVDGYEYIDYFGGHGALMLGHAHPAIIKAINEQIAKGTHYGACHQLEIEWAELIKKLLPSAERVEFTSSGTLANMLAVRLARAFSGRNKIVRFRGQFGGWYDSFMIGTAEPWDVATTSGLLPAVIKNTVTIPPSDENALEEVLSKKDVALLVCEAAGAFSGATGIAPSFYPVMKELTEKYGTLLLFDEVITGFRYSPGGVQTIRGVTPDLTSLGKNVTGGLPGAGALVGRADVMDMLLFKDDEWNRYKRVAHSGTFNANPLCAASGIATLNILATGRPQQQANKMTTLLREGLEFVIKKKGIIGCAYSEYSVCHLYFGECEMREKCDRVICLNSAKISRQNTGEILGLNLTINGVHTTNRGNSFFLSAIHAEKDIDETIHAFELSFEEMIEEGIFT
ncbi:Glutamate-1-semialdehyde 2,1-aminomutase 1 [subsurface metagenome]